MRGTLPLIQGVRPLSRVEIKKDISDIDCSGLSDAESTISVASDDVLNSSYPVKPRRYPKTRQIPETQRAKHIQKELNVDQNGIEETIEFLRVIETAKPEIYVAEREREDLEIKYQALRELCSNAEETFRKKKSFHENYLRILQSSNRSSHHLQDSLSLQNSLLYDLLIALKSRKKTFAQIGLQYQDSIPPIIEDSKSLPIFFYVSQVLLTPDGLGTIISVDKLKHTVSVYLPECNQVIKEYSTSTLYNFFMDNSLVSMDAYQKQSLERKWNYQSLVTEIPLEFATPFHQNIQHIRNFTEEDIYALIQPSQVSPSSHSEQSSGTSRKTKRNSKSNTIVDDSQAISSSLTSLSSPLCVPLITMEQSQSVNRQITKLFLKPGSLPYFVERTLPNCDSEFNPNLSLELLTQINTSTIYKHHQLPNPFDDSLFELLGLSLDSYSKYQSVDTFIENELLKLHEMLRLLLEKIRSSREETKLSALQVERSKMAVIQQFREMSSLRLGLFTHRLLMKSQSNGSQSENIIHYSQELRSLKDQSNNVKNSKSSSKSRPKPLLQATPIVVESLANSRPKRKKEEPQMEQLDLDDEEVYSQPVSSKSKKQRK